MADKTDASPTQPVVGTPIGPSLHTLTALAVGVVVVAALYFGQEVLLPVTVAVLLSFVLSPLVNGLRKLHVPHVVAVVFSVTVALGLVVSRPSWALSSWTSPLISPGTRVRLKRKSIRCAAPR
jgi:hypothetical protein